MAGPPSYPLQYPPPVYPDLVLTRSVVRSILPDQAVIVLDIATLPEVDGGAWDAGWSVDVA